MKTIIIVGGTGQIGHILKDFFIKKNFRVIITTRFKRKEFKTKKYEIKKINIYDIYRIEKLLKKYNPISVFYLAGQSSPIDSFKKKEETFRSNFIGCKNFLDAIRKNKSQIKFFNASSSEIFAKTKKKLLVNSKKKSNSPYSYSKLRSFNLTKNYRDKYRLKTYNIIFFNTESIFRNKNYLIPKICNAAIKAKKFNKKTTFGNLNIIREWNWANDQCKILTKFINKKPQDFILSNGKKYSVLDMIKFAFDYFRLDYRNYIEASSKFIRKNEVLEKKSNYFYYLKKNNIKKPKFVHGKALIQKMIKYYLKNSNNL